MSIFHFDKVDISRIGADFTEDEHHRKSLIIPFQERSDFRNLCIIGQNPSKANKQVADKTLYYLEKFVYEKMPEYSQITMLNLYSRMDTTKNKKDDLIREECQSNYIEHISNNNDFLIVFGKLKNQGSYKFKDRARQLKNLLAGKNVYKLDIDTDYAPHPGNKVILYRNFEVDYCYCTMNEF